jgi:hypothetical protein
MRVSASLKRLLTCRNKKPYDGVSDASSQGLDYEPSFSPTTWVDHIPKGWLCNQIMPAILTNLLIHANKIKTTGLQLTVQAISLGTLTEDRWMM